MSQQEHTMGTLSVGPIWRDANVRSGPSLSSPVIQLLLPGEADGYQASEWVRGDEVIEGRIISDVWFRLTLGGWCSAVNFDQDTVGEVLRGSQAQEER
jgi:hypothetical protein